MGKLTSLDIILGILYSTAALSLLGTAYFLYIKRFKRAKLEALNAVSLVTSRDNIFKTKTKFLVESPLVCTVKINLLDSSENLVKPLLDQEILDGEFPFDFDPSEFKPGKYFISLTTDNANILRGITIVESKS